MEAEKNNYENVLKLVIFDLDGIITDTAKYHHLAWNKIASHLNITLDDDTCEKLKGLDRSSSLDLILNTHHITLTKDQKDSLINEKNEIYQSLLKQLSPTDVLDGITQFITDLKNDGKKVAVGSSSRNAHDILHQLNLSTLFDTIVTGCDVEKSKPHPDIFLLCASRLNIDSQSCLVIEDAISGIEAANRAHMSSISVSAQKIPFSTYHIRQTSELSIHLLKKIFS